MSIPEQTPEASAHEVKRMNMLQDITIALPSYKLVVPPIDLSKPGLEIYDSGCCDGRYLRDLASAISNPSAKLLGTDLNTLMFPAEQTVGITLQQHDFREPFPSEWADRFDFVHQKYTFPAAMQAPVDQIVRSLCGLVKPGAYIQLTELDLTDPPKTCPAFATFFKIMQVMLGVWGTGHGYIRKVPDMLSANGLADVKVLELIIPFGKLHPDPELGEKGVQLFLMTVGGMAANASKLPPVPGVTVEEIERLPQDMEKQLREQGGSYRALVVTGQKPNLMTH